MVLNGIVWFALVHVEQVKQIECHDRVRAAGLIFYIQFPDEGHHLRRFIPEILHVIVQELLVIDFFEMGCVALIQLILVFYRVIVCAFLRQTVYHHGYNMNLCLIRIGIR